MYESLHHVSVVVTNLEKAKHFYGEVLGLKESKERPSFDFPGAWYQVGETQVHLLVLPDAKTLRGTTEIDSRDGHFAIRTKDMEAVIERLKQHNWPYSNRPTNLTEWHQLFVTDPDGNVIEINA